MKDYWRFRPSEKGIAFDAPDGVTTQAAKALWEFLYVDLGSNPNVVDHYIKAWRSVADDPVAATRGISGNGTRQFFDNDRVVIESLYDQWPSVEVPRHLFESFLDQYADYVEQTQQQ